MTERHIKQMTLQELESLLSKVNKDMIDSLDNMVHWYQLFELEKVLVKEAHNRAKEIGVTETAKLYRVKL